MLKFQAGYGYKQRKHLSNVFELGEGLVGQCALEKERILLTSVPADYVQISSGLGEATPLNIIVLPILFEGSVRAVIELASFEAFSPAHQSLLEQLTESIGLVLNTVDAASVTDRLLEQSLSQAALLAEKNSEVESKYAEVEEAKRFVEDKARELSVSSRYKSEFIANMSHELRTPLNSLLVLAEQLEDNPDGNLTERQVQYAHVIRSSGGDLLKLLNDILDLAKVESNTVQLDVSGVSLAELCDNMLQTFEPVAQAQGLAFSVELDDELPSTMTSDPHRLRQVLKNLLSNAFKFTERGNVGLRLSLSGRRIAFSVTDTGIGISEDLHATVFEAFAQADGSSGRKYGGTGLGLSISRNLAELLGGEITLASTPGRGSVFTVFLPLTAQSDVEVGTRPAAFVASTSPFLVNGDDEQLPEWSAGATALVVDDDFRNIFALTALLERGGMTVVTAESGEAALQMLHSTPEIAVVLMDIMMPGMNGYETIEAIRLRPGLEALPIIAVTGKVVGGERARCLAAGASDYIPKPVNTVELMTVLGKWLTTPQARVPGP